MQIDEARELIKFLHGAVPWNGTWFGECAPGERGAYWWRKHLDEAIAALIAAPAAPQQAEPVEIVPRVWREALRKLTFMARTSGGTPGPDEGLQTACAEAETLLSKPYNYPPAAPQQAEPVGYFVNDESDDQWHQVDYEQRNGADTYPLYLHPPAAPQQAKPVAWPAGHRWARNMAALESQSESDPTTPIIAPQQAEPVAWMKFGGMTMHDAVKRVAPDLYTEFDIPLYLHPPAVPQQADTCPTCGSECNERDELTKAEREIERLRAEVAALKAENARLHTANERMRAALERFRCRDWTPDWVRDIANRALEGGE